MTGLKKIEEYGFPSLKDKYGDVLKQCAAFQAKLNKSPDPKFLAKTPDGKANTLVISSVENTLREMYNGLVQYKNFEYTQILNEIIGTIEVVVFHPIIGQWLTYSGTASIEVMMNAKSDFTNFKNKKRNALKLGIPKLKSLCITNASQLIGNILGANLNRKLIDNDYNADIYQDDKDVLVTEINELFEVKEVPELAKIKNSLNAIKNNYLRLTNLKDYLIKLKDK